LVLNFLKLYWTNSIVWATKCRCCKKTYIIFFIAQSKTIFNTFIKFAMKEKHMTTVADFLKLWQLRKGAQQSKNVCYTISNLFKCYLSWKVPEVCGWYPESTNESLNFLLEKHFKSSKLVFRNQRTIFC